MEEWEEHLIKLLISKEIGEIIDIQKEAMFINELGNETFNYLFMSFLKKLDVVKCISQSGRIYKKIRNIPKTITLEKLERLTDENN